MPFLLLFVFGYWYTGLLSLLQGRFDRFKSLTRSRTLSREKPYRAPVGTLNLYSARSCKMGASQTQKARHLCRAFFSQMPLLNLEPYSDLDRNISRPVAVCRETRCFGSGFDPLAVTTPVDPRTGILDRCRVVDEDVPCLHKEPLICKARELVSRVPKPPLKPGAFEV